MSNSFSSGWFSDEALYIHRNEQSLDPCDLPEKIGSHASTPFRRSSPTRRAWQSPKSYSSMTSAIAGSTESCR
jgi:hypothetical protein